MAFAALRSATASLRLRPLASRRLAAGACAAAAASWAPWASAGSVQPGIYCKAGGAGTACGCQPAGPPAVGDGLDEVRQRIHLFGLRSQEEKLMSLVRELKADEHNWLKWFAEAEARGDDGAMRQCHRHWKESSQKIELLHSNPRKFAFKYGSLYDIKHVAGLCFELP